MFINLKLFNSTFSNLIDWIILKLKDYCYIVRSRTAFKKQLASRCVIPLVSKVWYPSSNIKIIWRLVRNALFGPFPRHTESATLGVRPSNLFIKEAFQDFYGGWSLRTDSLHHIIEWVQLLHLLKRLTYHILVNAFSLPYVYIITTLEASLTQPQPGAIQWINMMILVH